MPSIVTYIADLTSLSDNISYVAFLFSEWPFALLTVKTNDFVFGDMTLAFRVLRYI